MNPLRHAALVATLLAASLLWAHAALAEPVDTNLWVTNGSVFALAQDASTIYVGGQFTEVSSATGAGIVFDPATGATLPGYPQVVGRVLCAAGDVSGGVYIGGLFTSVGGQARANVAHIAADLSVSAWNPGTNGAVLALDVGPTATVYMGGEFTLVGGQARDRIAAVASNGAVTSWNPSSSGNVHALEVTGGSVYTGGNFNFIGGSPRANIAILSTSTGLATTWNPGCNGTVRDVQIVPRPGPSNTLVVGGTFTTIAGVPRSNLAELTLTAPGSATAWAPNPNGTVHTLLERLTTTFVGGEFTIIAGQPRNRIASVDPVSGFASTWNPNADGPVYGLTYSSGHVVIGGRFANAGGQARSRLAKIDEVTGAAAAWDPRPNEAVLAIQAIPAGIFAGGDYTGLNGLLRRNFAAFDAATGALLPYAPDVNGAVRALHVVVAQDEVQTIYLGGDFTTVDGQTRTRLAALDGPTGAVTAFSVDVNGPVWALALRDTVLYMGGQFTSIAGNSFDNAGAVDVRTSQGLSWFPEPNGIVFAIAVDASNVYMGGTFTQCGGQPRSRLGGTNLGSSFANSWNPNANATVRSLLIDGSTVYAGGDFTALGVTPRSRLAQVNTGLGTVLPFNPIVSGIVRSLARSSTGVFAGGDFTTVSGIARMRAVEFDRVTGAVTPWTADFADLEVWALAVIDPVVYAGGRFHGVGSVPQANFAAFGSFPPPVCPPGSSAGTLPRMIVSGDFDNDGIRDLVVGNATLPPEATVLRGAGTAGVGDGMFAIVQTLPLDMRARHAAVADLDADGFEDLVVSLSDAASGRLRVYPNQGGTFGPPLEIPLYGRVDGVAIADMDQDGILDLVPCLFDSAGVQERGGAMILRGSGTGGVWSGGFESPFRPWTDHYASARKVTVQDFNNDGTLDLAVSGGGSTSYMAWFAPGMDGTCLNLGGALDDPSGVGHASGDFNEDGLADVVALGRRQLRVRLKNASLDPECAGSPWFVGQPVVPLPSTPRDLAVLDFDQDGILDIVYTLDTLGVVGMLPGLGVGDVGDGTFGPPTVIATMDAWGLAVGDFITDGVPDLAVSQNRCGAVTVFNGTTSPFLPNQLLLVTPNGGEIWPQAGLPPIPTNAIASTPWVLEDATPSPALASPGAERTIATLQQVTWNKGAGVQGVDVSVSRNGGTSWQPIATNVPGTAMTWIVTPPASANARIRVSDAAVAGRADVSDAAFEVVAGTTDVDPDGGLPSVAAFALSDRNPARGSMRFRLNVPRDAEVEVEVFNAAGRLVRVLARGPVVAGRHDLMWDARDARGAAVAPGVYFVRGRVEAFAAMRKVVVLG